MALGYKEPTKAAREKVDPEDRGVSKIDTPSEAQEVVIILTKRGILAIMDRQSA